MLCCASLPSADGVFAWFSPVFARFRPFFQFSLDADYVSSYDPLSQDLVLTVPYTSAARGLEGRAKKIFFVRKWPDPMVASFRLAFKWGSRIRKNQNPTPKFSGNFPFLLGISDFQMFFIVSRSVRHMERHVAQLHIDCIDIQLHVDYTCSQTFSTLNWYFGLT